MFGHVVEEYVRDRSRIWPEIKPVLGVCKLRHHTTHCRIKAFETVHDLRFWNSFSTYNAPRCTQLAQNAASWIQDFLNGLRWRKLGGLWRDGSGFVEWLCWDGLKYSGSAWICHINCKTLKQLSETYWIRRIGPQLNQQLFIHPELTLRHSTNNDWRFK
jgi:hypothetical protein